MSRIAVGLITLSDINDGLLGARSVTRYLYRETESDTVPGAPSATLTWSTGVLSNITLGWSEEAPQVDVTGTARYWVSTLNFYQASGSSQSETTSDTGSTPVNGFSFDGIVTFSNSNLTDGTNTYDPASVVNSGTTTISGGQITTGTIVADKITLDNVTLTSDNGNLVIKSGGVSTGKISANAVTDLVYSTSVSGNVTGSGITQNIGSFPVTSSGSPILITYQTKVSGLSSAANVSLEVTDGTSQLDTYSFITYTGYNGYQVVKSFVYTPIEGSYTFYVNLKTGSNTNTIYYSSTLFQALEVKR